MSISGSTPFQISLKMRQAPAQGHINMLGEPDCGRLVLAVDRPIGASTRTDAYKAQLDPFPLLNDLFRILN